MAESQTDWLKLIRPEVGASKTTWGNFLNGNLDTIDSSYKIVQSTLMTALQTGANSGPIIDPNDPNDATKSHALSEDIFRIATQPLFYAENVFKVPPIPSTVKPGMLVPMHWLFYMLDFLVPYKTIIPFGGTLAEAAALAPYWLLCNAQGYTDAAGVGRSVPDLRGRFIVATYPGVPALEPGVTAGAAGDFTHTHATATPGHELSKVEIPRHVHTHTGTGTNNTESNKTWVVRTSTGGTFDFHGGGPTDGYTAKSMEDGAKDGLGGGTGGIGSAHIHPATRTSSDNAPPAYFALCYLMKVKNFYVPLPATP